MAKKKPTKKSRLPARRASKKSLRCADGQCELPKRKSSRIDIRLDTATRALITTAAEKAGVTITDFIVAAAVKEATPPPKQDVQAEMDSLAAAAPAAPAPSDTNDEPEPSEPTDDEGPPF